MVPPSSAALPALGTALAVPLAPLAVIAAGAVLIALVVLIVGLLNEPRDASSFARLFAARPDAKPADPITPPAERPAA